MECQRKVYDQSEKNGVKIRTAFFNLKKFLPQYRCEDILDVFLEKIPEAISLEGLTKKQIEKNVSFFPENLLLAPDWFFEDEEERKEKEAKIEGFRQMTLWELLQ